VKEKEFCKYLNHNKYIKVVINKNNKEKINYVLDFITKDITLKKKPNMTICNNCDDVNLTVYWDFNYVLVTNWLAMESKLKKRLKLLYKKDIIEAFLITWI
jgi:hypothetical protein